MKNTIYDLNDTISFGKHNGEPIASIIESNPSYVRWCIENVDSFALSATALATAKDEGFYISNELEKLNDNKVEQFQNDSCDDDCDRDEYDYRTNNYGKRHHDFAGSYAQDEAGYGDDVIYDAFEGDPDNYWNID